MAETPPGVRFTFLDYVALGFILEGTIAFLHEGQNGWKIWAPGFALGLITLAFRDKSPQLTARMLGWFRAPKKLAAVVAENVELKRQLETKSEPSRPRRLKIIEAHYGIEGINNPDVTDNLLERLHCDSYAELVGADLFRGFDPLAGNPNKKLTVRYSFDGKEMGIVRPEHEWLILPEDGFLRKLLDVRERELSRSQEACRRCSEDLRESANRNLEYRGQLSLFNALQWDAFTLARDLRDFYASLDRYPETPSQRPDETNPEWMVRYLKAQGEQSGWDLKMLHGYANRKFGERITALMHRAGEEFNYPAHVPNYAEKTTGGPNTIPTLAQQMDALAIWINRKQRGEETGHWGVVP